MSIVLVVILVALALVAVWWVRAAWRDRSVDFIHRISLGPGTERVPDQFLDEVLPVLVRGGYRKTAGAGHTYVFEGRRAIPAWAAVLFALVLFPIGVVALLFVRGPNTITLVASEDAIEARGSSGKLMADYLLAVLDAIAASLNAPVR